MRVYGNIYKVVETIYDGYFNVYTDKMIYKFEGKALVPKKVLNWMTENPNKCKQVNAFHFDRFMGDTYMVRRY